MKKTHEKIDVPVDLEAKLSSLIDSLEAKEKRSKRNLFWLSGIAASMVILFSIGLFHYSENTYETPIASNHIIIENPEEAIEEAKNALIKVAVNFNKGMEQLNLLSDNLQKTNYILNKTIKP